MKYFFALTLALVASPSIAAEITWEVHNNLSIFKSIKSHLKNGQEQFFEQLAQAQECEKRYHESKKVFSTTCQGPLQKLPALENVDANYVYDPGFVFSQSAKTSSGPRVRARRINFSAKFSAAAKSSECFWEVNGEVSKGNLGGSACKFSRELEVGKHKVRAWLGTKRKATESASLSFEVKDIVIVVLGNSYASGEGNPNKIVKYVGKQGNASFAAVMDIQKPAIWWEPRCHRSLLSSAHLGVALLAKNNPQLSVTLLSFACSGASILEGIVGPKKYNGIETQDQRKHPARTAGKYARVSMLR